MAVTITLNDIDSVQTMTILLSALDATGELSAHEELVAEQVLDACFSQEPALDPEVVDEEVAEVSDRLFTQ